MSYSIPGAGGVSSVNGHVGPVVLTPADLSLSGLYNPSAAFSAFGDSITVGVGASVPATTAYAPLLSGRKAWGITNLAVSGSQAADQADAIYGTAAGIGLQSTYLIGTNDHRTYLADANKQAIFQGAHLAELAWLTIPDANKVKGQGAGIAYTGTWANTTVWGGGLGKKSSTNGSTATMTLYGRTLYLATIVQDGTGGQFSVSIDGVNMGVFNCYGAANVATVNGRTYAPMLLRFAGLSEGPHTVIITVVSATAAGNVVYLDWAAGSQGNANPNGPFLWVGNIPRFSPAGYTTYGSSDAIVQTFNKMVRQNVRDLSADGLNVTLVDLCARLNPSADLAADGLHPNDSGHAKISDAFFAAMNQIQKPSSMLPTAEIERGSYAPIVAGSITAGVNTYIQNEGTWVKTNSRVKVKIAISMSAKDPAMAGAIYITIPPQFVSNGKYTGGFISLVTNTNFPAGCTQIGCYLEGPNNVIRVVGMGAGVGLTQLQAGDVTNTSQFNLTLEFDQP